MPFKSAWCSETAKPEDTTKASDSGTDCICPHGSQASSWPGAAAWTIDNNMASISTMDHGDPSRRSNPESTLFLIWSLQHFPESEGNLL